MLAACGGSDDGLLGDVTNASDSASDSAREEAALAALAARITLTIEAGGVGGAPGGTVHVTVGSSPAVAVSTGSPGAFTITAGDAVMLAASGDEGYRFAGWTLSGGLSCGLPTGSGTRCELDTRSAVAGASVVAAFAVSGNAVEVAVGPGGDLLFMVGSRSPETVPADSGDGFIVPPEDALTLTAEPRDGYTFARWALPSGLACMREPNTANPCELEASSIDATKAVAAVFEAINYVMTVSSGSGETTIAIGSAYIGTVRAGESETALVTIENAVTLTAAAAAGYVFTGWTLSGLACESGAQANPCELAAGSVSANAMVEATFEAVRTTLTVAAGANGSVAVTGAGAATVGPGSSRSFPFSIEAAATLTAVPDAGYALARWTSLGGSPACANGAGTSPCDLPVGSVAADTTVEAVFDAVQTTLTVVAGTGGSVAASVGVAEAMTVAADSSQGFAFSVEAAATLKAVPATGYAFAGWTSPDGLACDPDAQTNPCALAAGSATADATVEAVFEAVPTTLTVAAGANGSVTADVGGADAETVGPGSSMGFPFSVEAAATLTAIPVAGYAFASWTSPGGLPACADGAGTSPCELPVGSLNADATVEASFEAAQTTLMVVAGTGGSVAASVAGADAMTVGADSPQGFPFSVLSAATLTATATGRYAFTGWTLSPEGLACAGGTQANPCALPAGSVTTDATVSAAFFAPSTLTVAAGTGGSVAVKIGDASAATVTVAADSSRGFTISADATATLTATASGDYTFAVWMLSGGLACESGAQANPCVLPAGSVTTDTMVSATFLAPSTLTVAAGTGGSVAVKIGDASAATVTVAADSSRGFTISAGATATLTATAANRYAFAVWTLSGGLACESGAQANPCVLPAGSLTADATATFRLRPPAAWMGPGPVSVSSDGSTHTAVPYAPGAFENWAGTPCDGSTQPECDVSSVVNSEGLPAAVFRPFVVDGIKSLAFGLGYHGADPDHFRVSLLDAPGSGFPPVLGLDDLAPGSGPARLAVSVHLLPWGLGAYLTEACDAANSCAAASGGQRTLKQTDSVAATGYFKAPNVSSDDEFGDALALSGDGATLAVGAREEDSASSGTFAPGGTNYQAALDNNSNSNSGAVTVYRRSGSTWSVEAFVKAPKTRINDQFGHALALSADGSTLAVGAPREDSASTGTFVPGGEGYQAALDSDGANGSGAVTVYRRSDADVWKIEAFVKAPKTGGGDQFGAALALSGDGATLAVGATGEDSASTGTFALNDDGYQDALDSDGVSNSGAVTVYRRSGSTWSVEAFVKAPKTDVSDAFGSALALDSSGTTLAVAAIGEDSASAGTFVPGGVGYQAALGSDALFGFGDSGAVTVYRRSGSTWSVEAFVKAPDVGILDGFGSALALSADGATLAVGATSEDSASTGTFVPGGGGYQAALDSNGASNSGAVTVYRRSDADAWGIEAFVKAPKTAGNEQFGIALALSADGAMLAVGATGEDSASTGTFVPGGTGYQAALDSNGASNSGAVTVYRRSDSDAWEIEAFVKAPEAGGGDNFGNALALSADGAALAVGASLEDGGALPQSQPVGGDSADTGNAVGGSGAVYLY